MPDQTTCSVPDCNRKHFARGLCQPCYDFHSYRNTLPALRRKTASERFWAKVVKTERCWLWTGARSNNDYGQFNISATNRTYAHRFAYEELVGPIPDGLQLDHLCRVRSCVRPDHLEPVTQAENIRRGEGTSAVNARKRQCPKGHQYRRDADGRRICDECRRNNTRLRRSHDKPRKATR